VGSTSAIDRPLDRLAGTRPCATPPPRSYSCSATPFGGDDGACIGDIVAISCPTTHLCVTTDDSGQLVGSLNPARLGAQWVSFRITTFPLYEGADPGHIAISCAPSGVCALTNSLNGDIFTTAHPLAGPAAWHLSHIRDREITSISCPSSRLCVAVDSHDQALTSTDPGAVRSTWSAQKIDPAFISYEAPASLSAVACPSDRLCIAVDDNGNELVGRRHDPERGAADALRHVAIVVRRRRPN
jgi:hypothetical protein